MLWDYKQHKAYMHADTNSFYSCERDYNDNAREQESRDMTWHHQIPDYSLSVSANLRRTWTYRKNLAIVVRCRQNQVFVNSINQRSGHYIRTVSKSFRNVEKKWFYVLCYLPEFWQLQMSFSIVFEEGILILRTVIAESVMMNLIEIYDVMMMSLYNLLQHISQRVDER